VIACYVSTTLSDDEVKSYLVDITYCNFINLRGGSDACVLVFSELGHISITNCAFLIPPSLFVLEFFRMVSTSLASSTQIAITDSLFSYEAARLYNASVGIGVTDLRSKYELGEDEDNLDGGVTIPPEAGLRLEDVPQYLLRETHTFTASGTFTPYPVKDASAVFALASSIGGGVVATICGIMSAIFFGLTLYVRRVRDKEYKILGRFIRDDHFDGELQAHRDDPTEKELNQGKAAVRQFSSMSYTCTYTYSYSEDRDEGSA
jgi:hypothetical protein